MHRNALAKRRANALERLNQHLARFAGEHGLDAPVLRSSRSGDPEVRLLYTLETFANLFGAVYGPIEIAPNEVGEAPYVAPVTPASPVANLDPGADGLSDEWGDLGIPASARDSLVAAGFTTPELTAAASDDQLRSLQGVGKGTVNRLRDAYPPIDR